MTLRGDVLRRMTLAVLLCVAVSTGIAMGDGGFVEENDTPYWTGTTAGSTDGNPYTDANGNTWLAARAPDYNGSNCVDLTQYVTHTWSTSWGGYWNGAGNADYWPGELMRCGGNNNEVSALIFTPDQAGDYSFYGVPISSGGTLNGVYYSILKFSGTAGTIIHSGLTYSYTTDDLSAVSAVQNISLNEGDSLGIISMVRANGYWTNMDVTGVGIGLVPEPATMTLLAMGLVPAIMRRRK